MMQARLVSPILILIILLHGVAVAAAAFASYSTFKSAASNVLLGSSSSDKLLDHLGGFLLP